VFIKALFSVFILTFILSVSSVKAQNITLDQTLTYINGKFGKKCSVDVKKGNLTANFYDEQGKLFRKDKVSTEELNPSSVKYMEEEKMLIITCKAHKSECVHRTMIEKDYSRMYNRISFVYEGDQKSFQGLENAFTHLLRLMHESGYSNDEPFEK